MLFKPGDIGTGRLGANTVVSVSSKGDSSFTPPKTKTVYDSAGKIVTAEKIKSRTEEVLTRDEYRYDFSGNVTEYRDSRATVEGEMEYTSRTEYNWQGRGVKETNAAGDSKEYIYDLTGRVIQTKDETGGRTVYRYDEQGREIVRETEITETQTARTEKYYDLSGNMVKERIKNNKPGEEESYREICYEYDSMHRLVTVKRNDGTREIYTSYAYDSLSYYQTNEHNDVTVWGSVQHLHDRLINKKRICAEMTKDMVTLKRLYSHITCTLKSV